MKSLKTRKNASLRKLLFNSHYVSLCLYVYINKVVLGLFQPNRAIIDLGTVVNSGTNTVDIEQSKIYIDYEAVMISNEDTTDGGTYWLSVGAEYDNENFIWVGQASFTAVNDGNLV